MERPRARTATFKINWKVLIAQRSWRHHSRISCRILSKDWLWYLQWMLQSPFPPTLSTFLVFKLSFQTKLVHIKILHWHFSSFLNFSSQLLKHVWYFVLIIVSRAWIWECEVIVHLPSLIWVCNIARKRMGEGLMSTSPAACSNVQYLHSYACALRILFWKWQNLHKVLVQAFVGSMFRFIRKLSLHELETFSVRRRKINIWVCQRNQFALECNEIMSVGGLREIK